jgi:hypothetical protein
MEGSTGIRACVRQLRVLHGRLTLLPVSRVPVSRGIMLLQLVRDERLRRLQSRMLVQVLWLLRLRGVQHVLAPWMLELLRAEQQVMLMSLLTLLIYHLVLILLLLLHVSLAAASKSHLHRLR